MDWSVNQCRPIAQQSAKIVRTRPMQRNTLRDYASGIRTSILAMDQLTPFVVPCFETELLRYRVKQETYDQWFTVNRGVAARAFENANYCAAVPSLGFVGSHRPPRDLHLLLVARRRALGLLRQRLLMRN